MLQGFVNRIHIIQDIFVAVFNKDCLPGVNITTPDRSLAVTSVVTEDTVLVLTDRDDEAIRAGGV